MIGERISSYEVKALLGQGGMGAVYLAEHVMIGRKAAIKVLRKHYAHDESVVRRFLNEARAANAIGHPNIIDVIDVGTLPDGVPYLVMEYLAGESLGRRLSRVGRLPIDTAIDVACQAASGLTAAHGRGIVHRDLKPENLFLVAEPLAPGSERVKVLDFGIAKLANSGAGSVPTRPGVLIGTPQYMSPEQCRGISELVGPPSDIYSLGLIVYEMLCGAPPFEAAGEGDLVIMHATQPPPPLRSKNPALPASIEMVVLRALAKSRDDRYPSMAAFQEALSTALTPDRAPQAAHRITAPFDAAAPDGPPAPDASPGGTPALGEPSRPTTLSSSSSVHETAPVHRWPRRLTGGGAIAALAAVALVGALELRHRRGDHDRPPVVDRTPASPPPAVEPPRSAPSPPPAPPSPAPAADETPHSRAAAPRTRPPRRELVSIVVTNPRPGLAVTVDGRPAPLPLKLPRDGAVHRLRFVAPGTRAEVRSVRGDADQRLQLDYRPPLLAP